MLQQGLTVADVCYFIGEEQPSRSYLRRDLPVELPAGYAYDCINRDALLTRAKAKSGRLVLPDGISYRLLVLPPSERMTPEVAKKIGELAKAGVPVIGSLPTRSISLTNYPKCDENVREIVSKSWKSVRANVKTQEIFTELGLVSDLQFSPARMTSVYNEKMQYFSPPFAWNHRKTKDADIYFLSNQQRRPRNVDVKFRVTGKVPELWDAETGKIRDAGVWRVENGRTIVPVSFAPAGSVFVVFRRKTTRHLDPVAHVLPIVAKALPNATPSLLIEGDVAWALRRGSWQLDRQSGKTQYISVDNLPMPQATSGPWTVSFPPECGAPKRIEMSELKSLSEHKDAGVKYFSGTATYSSTFKLSKIRKGDRLFLDLGSVYNLAEVTVNGKNLGVFWKPPFVVEVTGVVKPGKNTLKIDVTNTWLNRLIGDAGLPVKDRTTWLLFDDVYPSAKTPLESSGLIGPVMLKTARAIKIVVLTEKEIT